MASVSWQFTGSDRGWDQAAELSGITTLSSIKEGIFRLLPYKDKKALNQRFAWHFMRNGPAMGTLPSMKKDTSVKLICVINISSPGRM
jgi:hypothetical protein